MKGLPQKPRVLHVATEMAPLSKVGGLGDVVGSLPKALRSLDVDARVLTPAWPGVLDELRQRGAPLRRVRERVHVALRWQVFSTRLWKSESDGIPLYLLDGDLFCDPAVYPETLTAETAIPFAFLSLAALELADRIGWRPQILHCHDWPAALTPVALRWHRHYRDRDDAYESVLTIHNLAHQGILSPSLLDEWGLDRRAFTIEGLEYYGQINTLKGGIIASGAVTTVSPSYSWEIQTKEDGMGLQDVLSAKGERLRGILNGLDLDVWDPAHDPLLPAPFDSDDLEGKATCRRLLLKELGWEEDGRPLACFIGRLVEQKGIDLLIPSIETLIDMGCRLVIVGSGFNLFERALLERASRLTDLSVHIGFSEERARLLYAGSDILLMPSLFEPCGLSQLIALRYGTIPVVRATGGLADTVIDADGASDGYGFVFSAYSPDDMMAAFGRALEAYRDRRRWREIQGRGMRRDFSWKTSAQAYRRLYEELLSLD